MSRTRSIDRHRAARPWRPRWCLPGALLACLALPASAQDENLPALLFEPVAIRIIEPDAPDAPYTVQELSSLPHASPAVDLQAFLAQRDLVPTLPPEQLAADIAAYEQSVQAQENAGGAFDANLDEELLALGSLLHQSGDYARAQQVLERALHVNRVNDGLFNMGQIPIIERTIETHLARGDLIAADAQHEYLLYVQGKNFDNRSVDLLPALTRYAEWNLYAFNARLIPPVAPAGEEGAEEDAARSLDDNDASMIEFRTGRLVKAQQLYESLITIVANNFGLADSRLLNFERQLALTNYLYLATYGAAGELYPDDMLLYNSYLPGFGGGLEPGRPPLGFRQGLDSLERRVMYLNEQPGVSAADKAQAKLDLADWMLLSGKRNRSLEVYQEAWQDMVAAGSPAAEVEVLFNPPFPAAVPSYLDHRYTRKALGIPVDLPLEYKGYIDLEFKLSRFGVPSAVRVRNKSLAATPALESMLLRSVRRAQYRPRITDGTVRDNETMHVRFYFTY